MGGSMAAEAVTGGPWAALRSFLRDLLAALRVANVTALASQVAYSLIFAMPSILLAIALVALEVDRRTGFALSDEVRTLIVGALPAQIEGTVTGLVNDAMVRARQGPTTVSAVLSIAVALFAAGNGLGELTLAFDRAAGIEDHRPGWQKRIIFAASAVLIALVLLVAFALYVFGGDLVTWLMPRLGLEGDWPGAWAQLQAPVIVLLVLLGTTLLYMTSCGCSSLGPTLPGALVSTLLWLVVIKGFAYYLRVAPPSTAYGAASSVLVFLVFLYLSSMALIVGSMTSAVIVRNARQRATVPVVPGFTPVPLHPEAVAESGPAGRG
jgi:membrane protein